MTAAPVCAEIYVTWLEVLPVPRLPADRLEAVDCLLGLADAALTLAGILEDETGCTRVGSAEDHMRAAAQVTYEGQELLRAARSVAQGEKVTLEGPEAPGAEIALVAAALDAGEWADGDTRSLVLGIQRRLLELMQ